MSPSSPSRQWPPARPRPGEPIPPTVGPHCTPSGAGPAAPQEEAAPQLPWSPWTTVEDLVSGPYCAPTSPEPAAPPYDPPALQEPGWQPARPIPGAVPEVVGPSALPGAPAAASYGGGVVDGGVIPTLALVREDLSHQIDGVTNAFATSEPFIPGTLEVWVDGLYQGVSPTHYVEVGTSSFIYTDRVPCVGEEIVARYQRVAVTPAQIREDLTSQIDGITSVFALSQPFATGTLVVFVDGLAQGVPGLHFEIVSSTQFRFLDWVLQVGEELAVRYST